MKITPVNANGCLVPVPTRYSPTTLRAAVGGVYSSTEVYSGLG